VGTRETYTLCCIRYLYRIGYMYREIAYLSRSYLSTEPLQKCHATPPRCVDWTNRYVVHDQLNQKKWREMVHGTELYVRGLDALGRLMA
jgi:hypothetical protein